MKKTLVRKRIEEYRAPKPVDPETAFNRAYLFISSLEDPRSDLAHLAVILPEDKYPGALKALIDFFDGQPVHFPSKEKSREAFLLAIVYYLYEIKKISWDNIKLMIDFDTLFKGYSLLSLGKRMVKIRKAMQRGHKDIGLDLERIPLDAQTTVNQVMAGKL